MPINDLGAKSYPKNNPDVWLSEEVKVGEWNDIGKFPLSAAIKLLRNMNSFTKMKVYDSAPGPTADFIQGKVEELIPILRTRLENVSAQ